MYKTRKGKVINARDENTKKNLIKIDWARVNELIIHMISYFSLWYKKYAMYLCVNTRWRAWFRQYSQVPL